MPKYSSFRWKTWCLYLISIGKRRIILINGEVTTGYSFCDPLYSQKGNSRSPGFRNVLKKKVSFNTCWYFSGLTLLCILAFDSSLFSCQLSNVFCEAYFICYPTLGTFPWQICLGYLVRHWRIHIRFFTGACGLKRVWGKPVQDIAIKQTVFAARSISTVGNVGLRFFFIKSLWNWSIGTESKLKIAVDYGQVNTSWMCSTYQYGKLWIYMCQE